MAVSFRLGEGFFYFSGLEKAKGNNVWLDVERKRPKVGDSRTRSLRVESVSARSYWEAENDSSVSRQVRKISRVSKDIYIEGVTGSVNGRKLWDLKMHVCGIVFQG